MTPRFYPVVKESRPVDAKVRWPLSGDENPIYSGGNVSSYGPTHLYEVFWYFSDTEEEEDPTQLQPTHGVPRRLGDGLQRAPLTYCLR